MSELNLRWLATGGFFKQSGDEFYLASDQRLPT